MQTNLPDNWTGDYIKIIRHLSCKPASHPDVKGILRVLKSLSDELEMSGRGKAWIPKPSWNGYYPDLTHLPYASIRTAVRKNTTPKIRVRAWKKVAASAEFYRPNTNVGKQTGIPQHVKDNLLAGLGHILPNEPGQVPPLMGKPPPGGSSGGHRAVIKLKDVNPDEWENQGFTMMHFASQDPAYKDGFMDRLRSGWNTVKEVVLGTAPKQSIPAFLRGATTGIYTKLATQMGLPPVLIGRQKVQGLTFDRSYLNQSSTALKGILSSLTQKAVQLDRLPELTPMQDAELRSLLGTIGRIRQELVVREKLV